MANWWEDQERQWGAGLADQGDDVRTVWNVLACARGPLDRRDLLELARRHRALTGDELDRTLKTLEHLVVFEPPRSYAVSHPRLGTFPAGQLEDDGDLATYTSIFIEWGLERVEALVPVEVPAYVVLHLREHLEAADATPDTLLRLADPGGSWLGRRRRATRPASSPMSSGRRRAPSPRIRPRSRRADPRRTSTAPSGAGTCWRPASTPSRSSVRSSSLHWCATASGQSAARSITHSGSRRTGARPRSSRWPRTCPRRRSSARWSWSRVMKIDGRAAELVQRLAEVGGLETARAEVDRRPPGFGHACAALALLHIVPEDEQPASCCPCCRMSTTGGTRRWS